MYVTHECILHTYVAHTLESEKKLYNKTSSNSNPLDSNTVNTIAFILLERSFFVSSDCTMMACLAPNSMADASLLFPFSNRTRSLKSHDSNTGLGPGNIPWSLGNSSSEDLKKYINKSITLAANCRIPECDRKFCVSVCNCGTLNYLLCSIPIHVLADMIKN